MSSNLKIPSPWAQLALLLLLAGGAIVLAAVLSLLVPGVHAGQIPDSPGTLKELQVLNSLVLFGLPAMIYAQITFRDNPLEHLGFRPSVRTNFYWLTILLIACALPLEGWLGMINKGLPLPHWMHQMEQDQDKLVVMVLSGKRPVDMIVNLVVVAVIPGFVEEMCFRGALQRVLIQLCRSPWAGIVLTGLWFSASHQEFEGFFPRAMLGILLGAAYWYSGSLWTVIVAHVVYNGAQVIAAMRYPEMLTADPSVPLYLALISLVFIVGLMAYMRRRSGISYMQVYQ
jgi:membrane protease YdiL (CAAX protease family)